MRGRGGLIVQDFPLPGAFTIRTAETEAAVPPTGSGAVFFALMDEEGGTAPAAKEAEPMGTAGLTPESALPDRTLAVDLNRASLTDTAPFWATEGPLMPTDSPAGRPRDAVPSPEARGAVTVPAGESASVAPLAAERVKGRDGPAISSRLVSVEDRTKAVGSTSGTTPRAATTTEPRQIPFRSAPSSPEAEIERPDGKLRVEKIAEGSDPAPPAEASALARSTKTEEFRTAGSAAPLPREGLQLAQRLVAGSTGTVADRPEGATPRLPVPVMVPGESVAPKAEAVAEKGAVHTADSSPPAPRAPEVVSPASALMGPVSRTPVAEGGRWTMVEPPKADAPSFDVASSDRTMDDTAPAEAPGPAIPSRDTTARTTLSTTLVMPVPPERAERSAAPIVYSNDIPSSSREAAERPSLSTASGAGGPAGFMPPLAAAPSPAQAVEVMPGWLREAEETFPSLHAADQTGMRKVSELAPAWGAPPSAEPARNVATQLVAAVSGGADGAFEIQLSPEELGRVTLTLQVTEDGVVLAIQAERQDTLDLMRRHADILQREFREAGFTTLSFSFGQETPDGRPARAPSTETAAFDDSGSGSTPQRVPPEGGRAPASSRLDLRL
jgi:hypothetical protein